MRIRIGATARRETARKRAEAPLRRRARLGSWVARAWRREDGSATVESVLWILMFFGLLTLIVDASFAFYGRAQAVRVLQDGNRAFSTGRLTSTAEVEAWVSGALAPIVPGAAVRTGVLGAVVWSEAELPVDALTVFGSLPGDAFTIRSAHYIE